MHKGHSILFLLLTIATPAIGQSRSAQRWLSDCRDGRWSGDRDREHFCDVREQTISNRAVLRVDGRENGGIEIIGADRNDILVISKIDARASSAAEAKDLADRIKIDVGDDVRADGPSTRWQSSWSVSYEIHVPRKTNLDLNTNNGGISIEGVEGRIEFEANNGGVSLVNLAGAVRGSTSNGGLEVELTGDKWNGDGLDVRTTNGGVQMLIPDNYSAQLETGTVNGGMNIGFPVTVQGRLDRRLTTQLGSGGPLVRATTTNGGVELRRQ